MFFTGISCRKGTSTMLGTLIFIGILFTAVIPMFLVMRQADTLHEMRKYELARLDEERKYENLHVYVFNDTESSENLTLRVENWGDFSVNIKQIWINDTYYPLADFNVQPMNWHKEELIDFAPIPDTKYIIKVTTDRGNVFYLTSGSLYCNIYGNWETDLFTIFFIISNQPAGWYDVNVTYFETGVHVPESPLNIHKSGLDAAYDFCNVPDEDTKYHVTIKRRGAEVIYNADVTIYWPYGPRSETVRV